MLIPHVLDADNTDEKGFKNMSYLYFLQEKCPCSLENCAVYKQMPTRLKIDPNTDKFYVVQVVNERYRYNPEYAILTPVDSCIGDEELCANLDELKTVCQQCRAEHPIDKRDKSFRPARIKIDLMNAMHKRNKKR